MKASSLISAGIGAAVILIVTASSAHSDDPVTSAVRFNREIVRIFDRKCLSCHAPGGIAMSLSTYRDVRPWARAIREEIVEQRMPPTSAVAGYARLKDNIALTPRELSTILTWVDGGVPKGDDSDLPPPHKTAAAIEPDQRVELPPQQLPGNGEDVVRRVTVDAGLSGERWVRQLQIRPGDRRVLRAAFVSIVNPDAAPVWAASWTPWQTNVAPAAPGAFLVRRGARLSVELHYRGQDEPSVDSSAVGLVFAADGTWSDLTGLALAPAPAARANAPARAEATLAHDGVVWGGRVDTPAEGASLELTAHRPDGAVDVLLWIPKQHPEWPSPFIFEDPVRLPAGTVLSVTTHGTPARAQTRVLLTLHSAR